MHKNYAAHKTLLDVRNEKMGGRPFMPNRHENNAATRERCMMGVNSLMVKAKWFNFLIKGRNITRFWAALYTFEIHTQHRPSDPCIRKSYNM